MNQNWQTKEDRDIVKRKFKRIDNELSFKLRLTVSLIRVGLQLRGILRERKKKKRKKNASRASTKPEHSAQFVHTLAHVIRTAVQTCRQPENISTGRTHACRHSGNKQVLLACYTPSCRSNTGIARGREFVSPVKPKAKPFLFVCLYVLLA